MFVLLARHILKAVGAKVFVWTISSYRYDGQMPASVGIRMVSMFHRALPLSARSNEISTLRERHHYTTPIRLCSSELGRA